MSLQCGIVGLPNVGKSTLFNCLSNAKAQAANFPFCTIEPNVGVITVPDERLNKLVEMEHPASVVPATVEIVDIAGLVKGASKGEGLGNKFLGDIRTTDAIIHVLRCFDDDNVTHVDGSVDPIRDKQTIDLELQFKDLETIENRYDKEVKKAKAGGDAKAKKMVEVMDLYREALLAGRSARTVKLEESQLEAAKDLMLLTAKPILYVCNVDEGSVRHCRAGDLRGEADVLGRLGPERIGCEPPDQSSIQVAQPADFPDGWAERMPRMDFQERNESSANSRHHSQRFRARLHPCRGNQI